MSSSLDLTKTFTSFAGVDIKVILNGHHAGSMQAISYAIQREKAPIYVMGTVDPISFSRGKRGIAGTMISLMMNYHMLYSNSFEMESAYLDKGELFGEYIQKQAGNRNPNINDATQEGSLYRELLGADGQTASSTGEIRSKKFDLGTQTPNRLAINEQWISDYAESDLASNYQVAKVFYMDQILPFDVVIHAANEYGHTAQMRLFGCEILNEGSGFSIDDMVIENQMTYVCRTLLPWSPISSVKWEELNMRNQQASGTNATPPPSTPTASTSSASESSSVVTPSNVVAGIGGVMGGAVAGAAGAGFVPALVIGGLGAMAIRNNVNQAIYGGNYLDTRIDEYNRDNSMPHNLRAAGTNPVR